MRQTTLIIIGIFALAGLTLSAYLTWYAILTESGICLLTGFFGCSKILTSSYSRIGRIPTALFGAVWFAVILLLTVLVAKSKDRLKFLLAWSLLAIPGVSTLVFIELVLIGAICPLCTGAHILGIAVMLLTVMMWRKERS